MKVLKFEPILKERIWGSTLINTLLGNGEDKRIIGENWTVSCRVEDDSLVSYGENKGKTLKELIENNKKEVLGESFINQDEFPLLIKIIHAKDNLSVQVHPDDEYATSIMNIPYGKTEMWYIIDAKEDAKLVLGLKDNVSKVDFENAIKNKKVMECLNFVPVKKGDIVDIPAGLVHAITDGILIAEVQQNCDTTFRVYDYDRVDDNGKERDLHVKEALETIDFENKLDKKVVVGKKDSKDDMVTNYIDNKYFSIDTITISDTYIGSGCKNHFSILTAVEGEGKITCGDESFSIKECESIFIPAYCEDFTITGNIKFLKAIPKAI